MLAFSLFAKFILSSMDVWADSRALEAATASVAHFAVTVCRPNNNRNTLSCRTQIDQLFELLSSYFGYVKVRTFIRMPIYPCIQRKWKFEGSHSHRSPSLSFYMYIEKLLRIFHSSCHSIRLFRWLSFTSQIYEIYK